LIKATGNVDHTERLVLARTGRVECWRIDCGRDLGCEDCRLLLRPERRRGT
jgi:hypothetical protein